MNMHKMEGKSLAFVTGDPAVNFSRKSGMANGPKAGVALRQSLIRYMSTVSRKRCICTPPESFLEILGCDSVWVIRWRSECDREVTECDIK